jgi:hypothetical protein
MYRQGDVLLIPVAHALSFRHARFEQAEGRRLILARGEQTGHHHSVSEHSADLALFPTGERALVVHEPMHLAHQEHKAIEITPGVYWVMLQSQYEPVAPPVRPAPSAQPAENRTALDWD